jgi:hypothetical protein
MDSIGIRAFFLNVGLLETNTTRGKYQLTRMQQQNNNNGECPGQKEEGAMPPRKNVKRKNVEAQQTNSTVPPTAANTKNPFCNISIFDISFPTT